MIAGSVPDHVITRAGAQVHIRWSHRGHGDFHIEQPRATLEGRRRAFVDLPWSQPDEVHGTTIGVVARPGDCDGVVFDGLVTDVDDVVLDIWVGDCAPVALVSENGRIGAVHAGWRGLEAGVLAEAVAAVRTSIDEPVEAVLGPCIHPCCYEFSPDDLHRLAARFSPAVVGLTRLGAPALDMPAAVRAALAEVGVVLRDASVCTGCHGDAYFSHRVRNERGRQMMAVWRTTTITTTSITTTSSTSTSSTSTSSTSSGSTCSGAVGEP